MPKRPIKKQQLAKFTTSELVFELEKRGDFPKEWSWCNDCQRVKQYFHTKNFCTDCYLIMSEKYLD